MSVGSCALSSGRSSARSSVVTPWSGVFDPGAPPDPRTMAIRSWWSQKIAYHRFAVAKSYQRQLFLADDGDDENTGLTVDDPLATWAAVNTLVQAGNGYDWIRVKRGSRWTETAGQNFVDDSGSGDCLILLDKPYCRLSAYGSGDNPIIDRFTTAYTTGWTAGTGDEYHRAETTEITALRIAGNLGQPLSRQTTVANCQATNYSFAWVSNVLYVNLAGTDPDTVTLYGLPDNQNTGFRVENTTWIEDFDFYGWGYDLGDTNSHHYGLSIGVTGSQRCVAQRCKVYYGNAHVAATWVYGDDPGGYLLVEDCDVGWMQSNGAGGGVGLNLFNPGGGLEAFVENLRCDYGRLPAGTSTYSRSGFPVGCHTANGTKFSGLYIRGTRMAGGTYGCDCNSGNYSDVPDASGDVTACRAFVCDEQVDSGSLPSLHTQWEDVCHFNSSYTLALSGSSPKRLHVGTAHGWSWNNQHSLNATGMTPTTAARVAFYDANPASGSDGELYHNHYHFVLNDTGNGTDGGFEYRTLLVQGASGNKAYNCIFSADRQDGQSEELYPSIGNVAENQDSNAYFDCVNESNERGYTNDAHAVVPESLPVVGASPAAELVGAGNSTPQVEYDCTWKPRNVSAPSIGPVEA